MKFCVSSPHRFEDAKRFKVTRNAPERFRDFGETGLWSPVPMFFIAFFFYYFQGFDMNKRCRMLREMVTASGYDPRAVFELMLNTAQFELKLKEVR